MEFKVNLKGGKKVKSLNESGTETNKSRNRLHRVTKNLSSPGFLVSRVTCKTVLTVQHLQHPRALCVFLQLTCLALALGSAFAGSLSLSSLQFEALFHLAAVWRARQLSLTLTEKASVEERRFLFSHLPACLIYSIFFYFYSIFYFYQNLEIGPQAS